MSLRAIFRFENLDSTQDLNDRFSGLFAKGVYEGGVVKPGPIADTVIIEPFKAMSVDGMAVMSDSELVISNVPSAEYDVTIVLEAKYIIDDNPLLRVLAIKESQYDPNAYIRLAKRNADGTYNYTDEGCVDRLSQVARNHFRGVFNVNEFTQLQSSFAIKDWCFVVGSDRTEIHLKKPNGTWAYYVSTDVIDSEIVNHIHNNISETNNADTSMGGAKEPTIMVTPLQVTREGDIVSVDIGNEEYGSFNISSNKWFASDSIIHKWELDERGVGYNYTHNPENDYDTTTFGSFIEEYYDENSHGTRFSSPEATHWYDLDIEMPAQLPSVNNRYLTENHPLVPTLDEKWALVGNFTDETNKPGKDNRFITQKTPVCAAKEIYFNGYRSGIGYDSGAYRAYSISATSGHSIYIGGLSNVEYYIRGYCRGNTYSDSTTTLSLTIKKVVSGQAVSLDSSDLITDSSSPLANRGFLKPEGDYVLVSNYELYGAEYLEDSTVDMDVYPPGLGYIHTLSVSTLFIRERLYLSTIEAYRNFVPPYKRFLSIIADIIGLSGVTEDPLTHINTSSALQFNYGQTPGSSNNSVAKLYVENSYNEDNPKLIFEDNSGNKYKVMLVNN